MYSIIYEPEALQDLTDIITYYFQQGGLPLAEKVNNKILASVKSLQSMPLRCPVADLIGIESVRKMSVLGLPYIVYFSVDQRTREVQVLQILHGSRRQFTL